MLTAEEPGTILHYDPNTGVFTRRYGIKGKPAGAIVRKSGMEDE